MAPRDDPPFRADHVGSLLRPPELLQAREDHAAGRVDDGELRAVEDAAIRDVVKLQRDVGLRTVTDGEFRRASWHMDFIYSLDGVSKVIDETLHVQFRNEQGTIEFAPPSLHVDGRIGLSQTIFGDAFEFLRSCASDGQLPKLTIPSPSMVHYRGGRAAIDESLYPELDEFWADLVAAYREEVRRLADLGDPAQREHVREIGGDAEHQHEAYIRHINEALADRPQGLAVTTHMCRGNFRSSWVAEGGYDFVAEALFGDLEVDGFFMEWDDARSCGFEPLRFVPPGKVFVLGLVTTKRGELEDREMLLRRIDEASRHVDLDQLCLSPQCGFYSTVEGNALTREQQAAKLRLVVDVAQEVWG